MTMIGASKGTSSFFEKKVFPSTRTSFTKSESVVSGSKSYTSLTLTFVNPASVKAWLILL